ncbi:hypothetical protein [Kitasatospora sp. NPDC015120]
MEHVVDRQPDDPGEGLRIEEDDDPGDAEEAAGFRDGWQRD